MEKLDGKLLQRQVNLQDQRLVLLLEAQKQRHEQERLLEEQKAQKRIEESQQREAKNREKTFGILQSEPFISVDELVADYYFYESDDGVSTKVDTSWNFKRDGEVFVLTEKRNNGSGGWGGQQNKLTDRTWIFASDTSRPLVNGEHQRLAYIDGLPLNLDGFEASRWDSVLAVLEGMTDSIDRKKMLVHANSLLDQHGKREIREKHTYKDITYVRVSDANGDTWTLTRANDSKLGQYSVSYHAAHSNEFWSLDLEPRNTHPRWHTDGKNRDSNHRKLYRDHIGMFKSGVAIIEQAVAPTLFTIEELT